MSGRSQTGATPHFGDFLQERGVIRASELAEALRSQSVYGGRLGTNLIELGYIGLEELAVQLAAYHGLEQPPPAWLEDPDAKAIKIVPMILLRRHKIMPLLLERERIHVAMLDPTDREQLDFIATAASRPVAAYVLPEVRLLYWLETHLQIDRHPRYVNLAARLRRTDLRIKAAEPHGHVLHAPGSDPAETPAAREAEPAGKVGPRPATDAQSLIDEWFAEKTPARGVELDETDEEELLLEELVVDREPSAPGAPGSQSGPLSSSQVAALEAELEGATDRDQVVDVVLRLARAYCEVAVLMLVRGSRVLPFRASEQAMQERLAGIEVPVGVHSIFAYPAVTGFPFRGSPPGGGIDGRILGALDREDVQDLLVQPIVIRDRVVNLLYCDNGSGAFGESSVAALAAVAHAASRAYERLILERKGATG